MGEIIDCAERAMCIQSGIDWDKQSPNQRARNKSIARAALEAIREPMCRALLAAQSDPDFNAKYRGRTYESTWPEILGDIIRRETDGA